jgi:4-hydroxy-tetrahydrodipicolinate reductase
MKPLRIALAGYGKMGQAVEAEALARGHQIVARIDIRNREELGSLSTDNTDVVIEFTQPETAVDNFRTILAAGLPLVTGTTGWHHFLSEVQAMVSGSYGSFLYGTNFSVGVNLMFRINQMLAKLMNNQPEYDVFVEERHHRHKLDAPSGTALTLVEGILECVDRKTKMAPFAPGAAIKPEELSVGYVRAGEITGEHSVVWTSAHDRLTLSHEAFSRRGFAQGAVLAAEWLAGRKGFYNFGDIFKS